MESRPAQSFYSFAPIGYLLLAKRGVVTDINMAGCESLERRQTHGTNTWPRLTTPMRGPIVVA